MVGSSVSWRPKSSRVAIVAVSVAVLAGCSGGPSGGGPDGASPPSPTTPVATIDVTPSDGSGDVKLDSPVVVTANAPLADVQVTRAASASQETPPGALAGELSADGRTWTSTGGLFADSEYQVVASTSAAAGVEGTTQAQVRFATTTPANSFKVSWEPVAGQTVGVGAPIALSFSAPAADRAAVESRLVVRTDPPVAGSWHWFHDRLVSWRPQQYWKPGTKVHVEANLAGLDAGDGRFGVKDRAMDFVIGPEQISRIDASTHMMEVYSNGTLVRTIPASLGRADYPTMDGPHNVLGKAPKVIMDSATVGIPLGNPEYYYEEVLWNVHFTSGGLYVHSAPWSEGSQGYANVSHGCVNISPGNAEWFFNFSRYGDIIDVRNTGRPPDLTQLGNDWSISWDDWVAGSALPQGGGPATPTPISGTPLSGAGDPA